MVRLKCMEYLNFTCGLPVFNDTDLGREEAG